MGRQNLVRAETIDGSAPWAWILAGSMLRLLVALLPTLRSALRSRRDLVVENLALRQQLATLACRWPIPDHLVVVGENPSSRANRIGVGMERPPYQR